MESGGDKGLVMQRCHGPSVLLIGPICLWQTYLRRRMGFKYDSHFLRLQPAMRAASGSLFQSSMKLSFACVISGPQDCWDVWLKIDTLLFFSVLTGVRLTKAHTCRYLRRCARLIPWTPLNRMEKKQNRINHNTWRIKFTLYTTANLFRTKTVQII